jgi:hypothetical protein
MIPTSIVRIWFLGLFSWVLLGTGIYLSHKWYQRAWSYDFNLQRSYFDPHIGYNHETLLLLVAACLLFWVLAGGLIVRSILVIDEAKILGKANCQGNREGQRFPLSADGLNYKRNVMAGRTPANHSDTRLGANSIMGLPKKELA